MSRVVVVAGATSGIGRATARAFAERGDRLVLAARATPTLAGEAVRGGHLPDLRQLARGVPGPVGAALRRRLG